MPQTEGVLLLHSSTFFT